MIQNIIVALIVLAAIAYAGYSVYRSLLPGDKPQSACGGCKGCDLKNLKSSCQQTQVRPFSGKALQSYPNRQSKIHDMDI